MATKSIGRVSKKALSEGKVKPSTRTPPHFAQAKKAKADRTEKGYRANVSKAAAKKAPAKKAAQRKPGRPRKAA